MEQRKDIQKARSHNRDILEREPKLSPAANNLAWLMAEQGGNYDEALSFAEKARAQPSDNPHIADTREWIYFKKNASLKVVPLFQETTEKLPENPVVQYHFGMAQFKNGDRVKAKKALEGVFQFRPNYPGSE